MSREEEALRRLSRREFVKGAALGAGALAGVGALASCAPAATPAPVPTAKPCPTCPPVVECPTCPTPAAVEAPIEWPWPYSELDVEYVRKLGHLGFYMGNCASGSFYGILRALREEVGYPYTLLPIDPPNNMLAYGGGGIRGWGTVCGGLLGSLTAINLVSEAAGDLSSELMGWYTQFAFPSDASNQYGSTDEFLTDELPASYEGKYFSTLVLPQSASGSPLCHVSVAKWVEASGYAQDTPEHYERCARLTADCAARAAELLNKAAAGQFAAEYVAPAVVAQCKECHTVIAQGDCGQCHAPQLEPHD